MKSLRHVNVMNCVFKFSDIDEHEGYLPSDEILDKVVSFSKPVLCTGKDLKRLLQRLPVIRKLSCCLKESFIDDEESIEILDFYRELECLKLAQHTFKERKCMINFPSTLKKLTIKGFPLLPTTLSTIAGLECLEVLKLGFGTFVEPRFETEDLVFRNLKFIQLMVRNLVGWNASTETFPCLEVIDIECENLEELPPCFGEMSMLKRISLSYSPVTTQSSALRIQQELKELGIHVEVSNLK